VPDDPINLLFRRVKAMHHGAGPWPVTATTANLLGAWFAELGYDIDGPGNQRSAVRMPDAGWPSVASEIRAAELARPVA
jgi:hypothetical protein